MKITRRDLGVLMIIAGIIIAFLGYKMSFEPTQEEIDTIRAEEDKLNKQIEELQPYVEKAPTYEKKMKEIQEKIDQMLAQYPADIKQEDNILYVVEMLNTDDMKEDEKFEADIKSFSASPATVTQSVDGSGVFAGKKYTLSTATITYTYTIEEYQDLKNMLSYVYRKADKDNTRKINTVSMVFNEETGEISGSVTLSGYVLTDGSKEYKEPKLPTDNIGIEDECLFPETIESTEK